MRLSLSSAAAPDAELADLLSASARRGIAALELVEGHAHGVSLTIDADRAESIRRTAHEAGIAICALRFERLTTPDVERAAWLAGALRAVVVVPAGGIEPGLLPGAAPFFVEAGARLLLAIGSDPVAVEQQMGRLTRLELLGSVGLAWDLRPGQDDPALLAGVLAAAAGGLRYVRLHGGGPEAAQQTGTGMGALMARLARERYAGPLVLAPSTPQYHYVWRAWLGRAGGWGCGSKQSDPSRATLEPEPLVSGDRR